MCTNSINNILRRLQISNIASVSLRDRDILKFYLVDTRDIAPAPTSLGVRFRFVGLGRTERVPRVVVV